MNEAVDLECQDEGLSLGRLVSNRHVRSVDVNSV